MAHAQRAHSRSTCRRSSIANLYFAGSAQRRLDEFHEMFARRDIKAIICARGGYGCNYLLPKIDLELVRANPKIFCGCSDVTTLLTYLCDAAGMVTFHGPMLNVDVRPDGVDEASWAAALMSGEPYHARVRGRRGADSRARQRRGHVVRWLPVAAVCVAGYAVRDRNARHHPLYRRRGRAGISH